EVRYLIEVANTGTSDARAVTVVDELPAGLTHVSSTDVRGVWARSPGPATGDQGYTLSGVLGAGATASFVLTAAVDPSVTGNIVNWAEASAQNSTNSPRDSDDSGVSRVVNLSIHKTHFGNAVAGGTLDYTI